MLGKLFGKNRSDSNTQPVQKFSANELPEDDSYVSVLLISGEILEGLTYSNGMLFQYGINNREFIFSNEYIKEWHYTEML